ncbi:hypothetical protein RE476_08305 [Methanolobus mangrovi]|uniref:Uncharacterized protein n=1 Tax=Methanolobus mangrovi TaxID=3072977 RepID=A0AA51YFY1_9EURY|nr:hypothetical protein [Methanolobus mangrovi]WMW21406.1 hypothetical protein RE476_08305 [Methanolobus mangrovi]
MKDTNDTQVQLAGFDVYNSKMDEKNQPETEYIFSPLSGKLSPEQIGRLLKISPIGEKEVLRGL